MEITAKARFIRMSPRKVRLVVDLIRGMDVERARRRLKLVDKAAAEPVSKLLESAMANAKNNFQVPAEKLYVKTITADAGPTVKRWMPRAFGRATPIKKRMTHISIVLDERGTKSMK